MLDVIADFWKPVKKTQVQEKLQPEQLQLGSIIGFGFVPQAMLSGRRLQVSAINTYQFGEENLTSYVLSQENEPSVSMIVAEAEGEQWLSISRRVSLSDRMRLFESLDLDNVITKSDITKLPCREGVSDFKNWTVASYNREHHGLKGLIFRGDFRKNPLPPTSEAQEFLYTLLVSDNGEYAIEIEKYLDGRVELYATIYRRMNDVGEITHPVNELVRPDIKLNSDAGTVSAPTATEATPTITAPAPKAAEPIAAPEKPAQAVSAPQASMPLAEKIPAPSTAAAPIAAPKPEEKKPEPIQAKAEEKPVSVTVKAEEKPVAAAAKAAPAADISKAVASPVAATISKEEKPRMPTAEPMMNGAKSDMNAPDAMKSKLYVQPNTPESYLKQEVKTVNNNGLSNTLDADAIECDLRVANKIIDEAIRNEMRLTDIVRRIIELPVAYPESVQIPITLTNEDYALLAIRYGISASDHNAIKRRILEDLNDFSGSNKKVA